MSAARARTFLALAGLIRRLPRIRGKVRFGLWAYRMLHGRDDVIVDTTLFREKLRFKLHLASAHERMAHLMNEYENATSNLLVRLWRGGAFLDVGANIGLITIPVAVRLPAGVPVFAVEAIRSNFEVLEANIAANGLNAAVRPICIGLGSTSKDVFVQLEGDDPSRTGTASILPERFDFQRIPLAIRPLDDLIADGTIASDIGLVKIDTDGYDVEVLRGAVGMLRASRPTILAELNRHCLGWHGHTIEDADALLRSCDYELWVPRRYGSHEFLRYVPGAPTFDNCLLLPAERAAEALQRITGEDF
jgi:FkbM family methyltransferase